MTNSRMKLTLFDFAYEFIIIYLWHNLIGQIYHLATAKRVTMLAVNITMDHGELLRLQILNTLTFIWQQFACIMDKKAFEGLKAFRGPDGKIRVFRMEENAARLQSTCRGICMAELPTNIFCEMVEQVVKSNEAFVPPYESGASLYLRPLLIGTTPDVGVKPASDFLCVIFATPVGPYFKGGFATNNYAITRRYDRAAPLGTGRYKIGGNYAASLKAGCEAHEAGYAGEFYLDAREKKYIDECGAANFFGIKNNTYITPKSTSILPSITNNSLRQIAIDLGLKVEERPIPEEELSTFEEAGACGTAAVISPINRIDDVEKGISYQISKDGKPGPWSEKLYTTLRNIQYGIIPDKYGWVRIIE